MEKNLQSLRKLDCTCIMCHNMFVTDGFWTTTLFQNTVLNGSLESGYATSMPRAKRWGFVVQLEKAVHVGPITLAIATCQIEQIEFVLLRWLVGTLNSVLVPPLIKAVRANLFSWKPLGNTESERERPLDDITCPVLPAGSRWKANSLTLRNSALINIIKLIAHL